MKKLAIILMLTTGIVFAAPIDTNSAGTDSAEGSPKVIMVKGTNNNTNKQIKPVHKIINIKNKKKNIKKVKHKKPNKLTKSTKKTSKRVKNKHQ